MKKLIVVLLIALTSHVFADTDKNYEISKKFTLTLIESGCRDKGLVVSCFEATKDECVAVQKNALDGCLKDKSIYPKNESKEELVNYVVGSSRCSFDKFLDKYMDTLKKEKAECRAPDMKKIFEFDKVIPELISYLNNNN